MGAVASGVGVWGGRGELSLGHRGKGCRRPSAVSPGETGGEVGRLDPLGVCLKAGGEGRWAQRFRAGMKELQRAVSADGQMRPWSVAWMGGWAATFWRHTQAGAKLLSSENLKQYHVAFSLVMECHSLVCHSHLVSSVGGLLALVG